MSALIAYFLVGMVFGAVCALVGALLALRNLKR
jgi:hypothetical protein